MSPALPSPPALVIQNRDPFTGPSAPKVREGHAFLTQGKVNEAAQVFQAAAGLDPTASWPLSGLAQVYLLASQNTSKDHVEEYRNLAEDYARRAIELNDLDFLAVSALKELRGGKDGCSHQPNPKAREYFDQAEARFKEEKTREAIALYLRATEADPGFTDAWLYLGDCYFVLGELDKAETHFRKAISLEPSYARAWRFLSDNFAKGGKREEALTAALGAVGAEPDDFTAWGRVKDLWSAGKGQDLTRFRWPRVTRATFTQGSGKPQLTLTPVDGGTPEAAAASAFNLMSGLAMAAVTKSGERPDWAQSPLRTEMQIWQSALEALEGKTKESKIPATDPSWKRLLSMHKGGDLAAAVLFLGFRESYRPDLEAWIKANPEGLRRFLDRYGLRP